MSHRRTFVIALLSLAAAGAVAAPLVSRARRPHPDPPDDPRVDSRPPAAHGPHPPVPAPAMAFESQADVDAFLETIYREATEGTWDTA